MSLINAMESCDLEQVITHQKSLLEDIKPSLNQEEYSIVSNNVFLNFDDFLVQYNNVSVMEKPQMLADFILRQETKEGGFPVIQNDTCAVFIYYDSITKVNSCEIIGDFTAYNAIPMNRLSDNVSFFYFIVSERTPIIHFEFSLRPTTRIDYLFIVDGISMLDPRNPLQSPSSHGENSSELAMPQFEQPTEIIYNPNIPHGDLTTLQSPWVNPKVQVYLPPNYNPETSYSTIYTGDGSDYIALMSIVNILDNLIADKRINPVIGVFIDPIDFIPNEPYDFMTRVDWYKCNPEYLTFLDGLVTYIDNTYSTNRSAYTRLHLGYSISGLTSSFVLIERPQTFKLLASQSGSFRVGSDYQIMEKYESASSSLDLKTWFSIGMYENNNNFNVSMVEYTESMAAICTSKDWPTKLVRIDGCHSYGSWRQVLDDMLEYFFPYKLPLTTSSTTITSSKSSSTSDLGYILASVFLLGIANANKRSKKKKILKK